MDSLSVLIDAFAVFRLARLVTTDTFPPILKAREWILSRWPSDDTDFTEAFESEIGPVNSQGIPVMKIDGTWFPLESHWLGELVSCPWCASVYLAAGVVTLRVVWGFWAWIALVLAFSAVAGLLSRLD